MFSVFLLISSNCLAGVRFDPRMLLVQIQGLKIMKHFQQGLYPKFLLGTTYPVSVTKKLYVLKNRQTLQLCAQMLIHITCSMDLIFKGYQNEVDSLLEVNAEHERENLYRASQLLHTLWEECSLFPMGFCTGEKYLSVMVGHAHPSLSCSLKEWSK